MTPLHDDLFFEALARLPAAETIFPERQAFVSAMLARGLARTNAQRSFSPLAVPSHSTLGPFRIPSFARSVRVVPTDEASIGTVYGSTTVLLQSANSAS